jgi:hypothetical protein
LDYDEIVLDDATPRTLAFGPALLLSGTAIGKPGNVLPADHRTSWFRSLEKIAQATELRLRLPGLIDIAVGYMRGLAMQT